MKALGKNPRQLHLFVGVDDTDPTVDINVNNINGLAELLKSPAGAATPDQKNGESPTKPSRGGRKNSLSSSDGKQNEKPSPAKKTPVKKTPVKDKHPKKSPVKPKPPQIQIPKSTDAKKVIKQLFLS